MPEPAHPSFLLLSNRGPVTFDVGVDGALSAHFVRSTAAHAHVRAVETAIAAAMPGVVAVFTAADFAVGSYCQPEIAHLVPRALYRPPIASTRCARPLRASR